MALGGYIEKLEGEEHATVFRLEEYCEALFQIHEELNTDRFDEEKIQKTVDKNRK